MKNALYIFVLFFVFAACKMGKNYNGTNLVIPQNFAQADTTVTVVADTVNTDTLNIPTSEDIKWWDIFDDEILDTLVKTALVQNKDALIAAESIMQARYALNIQNADFLPKFDVTASAQRGNYLFNQVGGEQNLFLGATSVYWEIDLWGKLRRLSEAARADLAASEAGYRGIMVSLISEVASTYFALLQTKSQLEIAKRNAASRDSMLLIIQARYDKGIVPMIDVNQAEIQLTIAEGTIPIYERNLVQLENALSVLVGKNPGPISTGKKLMNQKYDIAIPLKTPLELLARRPDVIAAEFALMAQNARVGAAQANRLPTISLSATLGIANNDFSQLNLGNPLWNLGAQMLGPLFYWNQRKRMADIEQSKRFQALFAYENTVLNSLREVEDVLVEIRTAQTEIEIAKRRKAAAINAQELSRERYSKGVTSYLEFLEQQRQAFDAELILEEHRASLLTAYTKLYKALGGGWINQNQNTN